MSGGFIHLIVNHAIGPQFNPTSENIYLPSASAAQSAWLVAHEDMHALLKERNASFDADYNSDSVARAISEGYADANGALFTGDADWIVNNDWTGNGSGARNLAQARSISEHNAGGNAHTNGRIIGHVFYRLATISGGSSALAKEILLRSVHELNKNNDGIGGSWSYEDARQAMLQAAQGNGSKENIITNAWAPVIGTGSSGPAHVVKQGDFNSDGQQDVAVIATSGSNALVDDFILQNLGGGNYSVVLNPTSSHLNAARSWPTISGVASVGDVNLDGQFDTVLTGISGISDFVVWSADNQPAKFPTRTLRLDASVSDFISDLTDAASTPNWTENVTTTQTISQSGWYVVTVFLTQPGCYYDEFWVYRCFGVGWATIIVYLEAGFSYGELDPGISVDAFNVASRMEIMNDSTGIDVSTAAEEILVILESVLNTDLGIPDILFPWSTSDDSRVVISVWFIVSEILREILEDPIEEAVKTIQFTGVCYDELTAAEAWKVADLNSYIMPDVSHSPTQNFQITTYQFNQSNGSTDTNRRNFWIDRWNTSKDPMGPLAVDVVDDEFLLGCLANRRYLDYAGRFGATQNVTSVGVLIMQEHRDSTNIDLILAQPFVPGKLGRRQVADYHHLVFNGLGLPNKTFGGTPLYTGDRDQAKLTGIAWCPSCDDDN